MDNRISVRQARQLGFAGRDVEGLLRSDPKAMDRFINEEMDRLELDNDEDDFA